MTESAWLNWIRSALRSKSLRWLPRAEALKLARRPYKGDNKLQKWEYQCAICKQWWKAKEVVVDHFPKPAGSILRFEDIGEFCNNLYCEVDNLRILDINCHKTHTLAEKKGITFGQAAIEQKAITTMKLPLKEVLAILHKAKYNDVSNAAKRRAALIDLYTKECDK